MYKLEQTEPACEKIFCTVDKHISCSPHKIHNTISTHNLCRQFSHASSFSPMEAVFPCNHSHAQYAHTQQSTQAFLWWALHVGKLHYRHSFHHPCFPMQAVSPCTCTWWRIASSPASLDPGVSSSSSCTLGTTPAAPSASPAVQGCIFHKT